MKNIKSKFNRSLLLIPAVMAAGAGAARADVVTDATAEVTGFVTSAGLGAAAIIAVAAVFVGIKVAKRVFGKL